MHKLYLDSSFDIKKLDSLNTSSSIILSLPIHNEDLESASGDKNKKLDETNKLKPILSKLIQKLDNKWLLFVYWSPSQLINVYGELKDISFFQYWVALDFLDSFEKTSTSELKHNHVGILMVSKSRSYIPLNTKEVKIPYCACNYCNKNIKDWGWKKHLMNPKGTWITDVWKDFYAISNTINDESIKGIKLNKIDIKKSSLVFDKNQIPDSVANRLKELTSPYESQLIVITENYLGHLVTKQNNWEWNSEKYHNNEIDSKIILWDCIRTMEELVKIYPDGIFDLSFADPPYNLSKNYTEYDDKKSDLEYINWCNKWLELMVKLTKKDWNIVILNIPKWSLEHALELNKHAYLHNWIVWDALSVPNWKLLPAHYSLLRYSKSQKKCKYNNLGTVDSPEYCLRSNCIKKRKEEWFDNKIPISDIWADIYRIKHKRDRDNHPCQLPDKLMNRIINMFSSPGDLIFDPFCWAWTTAIAALRNNRKYYTIELDKHYWDIASAKVKDFISNWELIKKSVKRVHKWKYTKKMLEQKLQTFAKEIWRKPTFEEFVEKYTLDEKAILAIYSDVKDLLKSHRHAFF